MVTARNFCDCHQCTSRQRIYILRPNQSELCKATPTEGLMWPPSLFLVLAAALQNARDAAAGIEEAVEEDVGAERDQHKPLRTKHSQL